MIIDAIPFSHGIEMLNIRFNMLNPVVDKFVICEGTHHWGAQPKPLEFTKHAHRWMGLPGWRDKVVHLIVDDIQDKPDRDSRQFYQRDRLRQAVLDIAKPTDTVLWTDADEIPDPEALSRYHTDMGIMAMEMRFYRWFLNCEDTKQLWSDCKILPAYLLRRFSAFELRYFDALRHDRILPRAGWHFSSCGGREFVLKKIECNGLDVNTDLTEQDLDQIISDPKTVNAFTEKHPVYVHPKIDSRWPWFVQMHEDYMEKAGLIWKQIASPTL